MQKTLVFIVFVVATCAVHALTPPLSPEELQASADVVVEGVVGSPIRCIGPLEKHRCADTGNYAVPFTILKVVRGDIAPGTTTLYFWHNHFHDGCVGDQGSLNLPGEAGLYYARKVRDGITPVHWSAVERTTEGRGELPTCPAAAPTPRP